MLQPASCALNTADRGRDADMQVMFGDVVQYSEKALTSVFPFRECLLVLLLSESMKRRHLKFRCLTGTQCSGADCVLIFLGAAPCTAPKFYIFTKANMCVNCSVQCAAQRSHQTISLCIIKVGEYLKSAWCYVCWLWNILTLMTRMLRRHTGHRAGRRRWGGPRPHSENK